MRIVVRYFIVLLFLWQLLSCFSVSQQLSGMVRKRSINYQNQGSILGALSDKRQCFFQSPESSICHETRVPVNYTTAIEQSDCLAREKRQRTSKRQIFFESRESFTGEESGDDEDDHQIVPGLDGTIYGQASYQRSHADHVDDIVADHFVGTSITSLVVLILPWRSSQDIGFPSLSSLPTSCLFFSDDVESGEQTQRSRRSSLPTPPSRSSPSLAKSYLTILTLLRSTMCRLLSSCRSSRLPRDGLRCVGYFIEGMSTCPVEGSLHDNLQKSRNVFKFHELLSGIEMATRKTFQTQDHRLKTITIRVWHRNSNVGVFPHVVSYDTLLILGSNLSNNAIIQD